MSINLDDLLNEYYVIQSGFQKSLSQQPQIFAFYTNQKNRCNEILQENN